VNNIKRLETKAKYRKKHKDAIALYTSRIKLEAWDRREPPETVERQHGGAFGKCIICRKPLFVTITDNYRVVKKHMKNRHEDVFYELYKNQNIEMNKI